MDDRLEWVTLCPHDLDWPHWVGDDETGRRCEGNQREVIDGEGWTVFTDRGGRLRITKR